MELNKKYSSLNNIEKWGNKTKKEALAWMNTINKGLLTQQNKNYLNLISKWPKET